MLLSSFYDQHLFLLEIVRLGSSRLMEKTGMDFLPTFVFVRFFAGSKDVAKEEKTAGWCNELPEAQGC